MQPTDVSLHAADDGRWVLCLEHRYEHPVRRVWHALTDSVERTRWSGVRTEIEATRGGAIRCWFGDEPERGRVLDIRPPRLLVHTGRGDVFCWVLDPDGDGCRLVLRDTVAEPAHLPWSAAAFHEVLDRLEAHLDGSDPTGVHRGADSWFDRLVQHYTQVLRTASPVERQVSNP